MSTDTFINKLRLFLGLRPGQEPPRNDFRNPIWGSDEDDDGDELYTRNQIDVHNEFTKHMHDMFRSVGGIFGDMKAFFNDDIKMFLEDSLDPHSGHMDFPSDSDNLDSNVIRDYYLKPGYHGLDEKKDVDLDGKLSSQDISGLLKQKEDTGTSMMLFDNNLIPSSRSFCQTIITTSVKKPDGTVETRKIIKKGNEVIEETTTVSPPDARGPHNPGLDAISATGTILTELSSLFKNFY